MYHFLGLHRPPPKSARSIIYSLGYSYTKPPASAYVFPVGTHFVVLCTLKNPHQPFRLKKIKGQSTRNLKSFGDFPLQYLPYNGAFYQFVISRICIKLLFIKTNGFSHG